MKLFYGKITSIIENDFGVFEAHTASLANEAEIVNCTILQQP
jgi:hypothetical protein